LITCGAGSKGPALLTSSLIAVDWYEYVRRWATGESNERIASNIGVTGATVGRWKLRAPNPRDVTAFCRYYDRPLLEGMIAAGFLTEEEAGQPLDTLDPRYLTDDQLVAEIARRLGVSGREEDLDIPAGPSERAARSSRLKGQRDGKPASKP
jgi:hypothetical protein